MAAGSTHTWHPIMYQFAKQEAWPCSSSLCPSINSKSLHLVLKCLEYVSTTHSYFLSVFFFSSSFSFSFVLVTKEVANPRPPTFRILLESFTLQSRYFFIMVSSVYGTWYWFSIHC